jgi:hypothetical protein
MPLLWNTKSAADRELFPFNQFLSSWGCHGSGPEACTMEGISWNDLDASEQRTIAMLADGVSNDRCDPVALLTLSRIGLVRASRLTASGELLLSAAVRHAFAA